jgi:salicylate hydroxylase
MEFESGECPNPSIVVIGAGIGGLCLAQNLKKNGLHVAVYERNHGGTYLAEGYWIEVNREGIVSLRECLTSRHFDALMATGRRTVNRDCRWFARSALQKCLLHGLEDVVKFDKAFVRYEEASGPQIVACFADGTSAAADVLVAADGVHSKVRQQFLPHARRIDTGAFAVGGTADLTAEISELLPSAALDYPIALNDPNNQQMFIAVWLSPGCGKSAGIGGHAADPAGPNRGLGDHDSKGRLMWRFSALTSAYRLCEPAETAPALKLKTRVLEMMTSWSPNLRRLVELIDPATVFPLPIRSCVPFRHWATGPVTLLGDAIHGMAPYGGLGANTAMRDAGLLGQNLSAAGRREKTLLQAIYDYEAEMIEYGFDAVRRSMQILQQVNRMDPKPLPE